VDRHWNHVFTISALLMSKSKMVDADIRSLTADDMQDSQDIRYSLP